MISCKKYQDLAREISKNVGVRTKVIPVVMRSGDQYH